jgi:hydrogenase maturation factor
MCLADFGVVTAVGDGGAAVEFDDGSIRTVSIAVLVADHIDVAPGDRVVVSMGMALRIQGPHDELEHWAST